MSSRMGILNLALALEGRVKAAPENEQLVVIADALAELPTPTIDRGFMLALEQRILTEDLAVQQAGQQVQPGRHLEAVPATVPAPVVEPVRRAPVVQMPKRRFVVRRSLVAIAAAASLAAVPVAFAASALPGSPFYGLKRVIEQVMRTDVTEQLVIRMNEYEALSALDPASTQLVSLVGEIKHILVELGALVAETTDPATLREIGVLARDAELLLRGFASASPGMSGMLDGAILATLDLQRAVNDALGIAAPSLSPPEQTLSKPASNGSGSSRNQVRAADAGKGAGKEIGQAKRAPEDPDGFGRYISEPAEGCRVPFSDRIGDWLAPAAKIMCSS